MAHLELEIYVSYRQNEIVLVLIFKLLHLSYTKIPKAIELSYCTMSLKLIPLITISIVEHILRQCYYHPLIKLIHLEAVL